MKPSVLLPILTFGLSLAFLGSSLTAQKFLQDDPIGVDHDKLPTEMPQANEISQILDFVENTFRNRPNEKEILDPAENINTLGEVPNSSWFTNRIGKREMSLEELVRGPNQLSGPDLSQPWVILRAKTEGVTPGFTIQDGRDDIYFIKFDPPKHPQLATSAGVIATKFFYAFGYNVPENYLARIRREDVQISGATVLSEAGGDERNMEEADVDAIFDAAPKGIDGRVQVIASRRLSGRPIGPFTYMGTRSDDPNDVFVHENRRELRGLRIFAAWLNHDDVRSINSLDIYLQQSEKGYVQHYLIDFGSCLGSGSIKPQNCRAGNDYMLEWKPSFKAAATLGIWDRPWRHVRYPNYPSIGRFEAEFFQPTEWKPEYPNPAFDRMRPDDAFWATRIVARFTNEMIRAVVQTGQIEDPEAENYLVETLIKRRDKIVAHYLNLMNPLSDFKVVPDRYTSRLEFQNLGEQAGLSEVSSYQYQWYSFDNSDSSPEPLGQATSTVGPVLEIPNHETNFLMAQIRTISPHRPAWKKKVDIYVRNGRKKTVVGIEREQ